MPASGRSRARCSRPKASALGLAGALEPELVLLDVARVALESVRELRVPAGDADGPGLSLMHGSPQDGPHAEITEAATLADGLTALVGVHGYEPPEGTALLAGSAALLRSNGLVVAIHASDEQTAIAAARSLQPYSG
jgi:hypothetical protein